MRKMIAFIFVLCSALFAQTGFKPPATAVSVGGAAGGDLSGTYPNPSVQDDSHAHATSTISGLDLTNDLSAFTSADLFGRVSNETGSASGSPLAVFNQAPALAGATLSADIVFSAGTIDASSTGSGSDAFTTTAVTDTVTISGAANTDRYSITLTGAAAPGATDAFKVEATSTGFVIHRGVAGTSGLTYTWLRVKP